MDTLFDEKAPGKTLAEINGANTPALQLDAVDIQDKLTLSLDKAKTNIETMVRISTAASLDLSKITVIDSDEMDALAEKILVKARGGFEKVQTLRKEITAPIDGIKDLAMLPEKRISTDAKATTSEYYRVKTLRDAWAQKKLLKKQEEEKKALAAQNKAEEITRLKAYFTDLFFNKVVDCVSQLDNSISSFLAKVELKDFDEKIKMLNVKPNIKKELFDSWFITTYDKTRLTEAEYTEFLDKVKSQFTYEKINGYYQDDAQPKIDEWKAKLPARRAELVQVEELRKTNAEEAEKKERELLEESQRQQNERNAEAENVKQENAKQTEHAANEERLEVQFDTLRVTQAETNLSGTRTKNVAVITAPDAKIIEVVAKMLFQCYQNPKFEGHVKKDKATGAAMPPDTNGIPVYTDWIQTILDFFALNVDHAQVKVDGIEIKQIVSTTARKTKEK